MSETPLGPTTGLVTPRAASYRASDLKVRVLGPLEVLSNGVDVRLGGPKQRTVLALLAAEVGKRVSVDTLIEGVWGDEPTTGAHSTLQTYVSNLRAAIGDVIVRDDGGYRLVADPENVDAVEFERAVEQAAALVETEPADAAQLLGAALALWRGHPYADVPGPFPLELEARRLDELRLRAVEMRIEAELVLGRHAQLIAELDVLCEEFPVYERFRAPSGWWHSCRRRARAPDRTTRARVRRFLRDHRDCRGHLRSARARSAPKVGLHRRYGSARILQLHADPPQHQWA